ncbi:MAG: hypothetical protein KGH58_01685 [Candidatus Micrarchaeota archaeon]|nr:hypothetical protein [Candidatus Micrarchaeota archaeon]
MVRHSWIIFVVVAAAILGSSAAAANAAVHGVPSGASGTMAANTKVLASASHDISCKSNFTISVINDVVGVEPGLSSNLTSLAGQLQQASSRLQSYANTGNLTIYKSYLLSTYDPLLKQINSVMRTGLKNSNLTSNETALIRQQYNSSSFLYKSCNFKAVRTYASERLAAFSGYISYYQNISDNMSARGIDTSAINTLLRNAQDQVVSPFAQGINSSTNATQIMGAVARYCLFNECPGGSDFHLSAKFEINKTAAIIASVNSLTNGTANTAQAQSYLSDAGDMLSGVGSSTYTGGQQAMIFGNLTMAANSLRSVISGKASNGGKNG